MTVYILPYATQSFSTRKYNFVSYPESLGACNMYIKSERANEMQSKLTLSVVIGVFFFTANANADLFVYPQKGQNKEQQAKDESECYTWSVSQTNFDPKKPTEASTSAQQQQSTHERAAVRGAARGAAIGAAGGAIAGDAGKGAAIGAATGGLGAGMKKRHQQKEQEQANQELEAQQKADLEQKRSAFNRAYGACLEGRGYTVK